MQNFLKNGRFRSDLCVSVLLLSPFPAFPVIPNNNSTAHIIPTTTTPTAKKPAITSTLPSTLPPSAPPFTTAPPPTVPPPVVSPANTAAATTVPVLVSVKICVTCAPPVDPGPAAPVVVTVIVAVLVVQPSVHVPLPVTVYQPAGSRVPQPAQGPSTPAPPPQKPRAEQEVGAGEALAQEQREVAQEAS